MPVVGIQSKLRPKIALPVALRAGSTTMVEQPNPLDRSAIVFAKSSMDGSRPDALAAASISAPMWAGKRGREFARGEDDRGIVLVLLRVLEEALVEAEKVRAHGDGELAELLAHLRGSAPHGQNRYAVDVPQFALAVLPGGKRFRLSSANCRRKETDREDQCESIHGTYSRFDQPVWICLRIPIIGQDLADRNPDHVSFGAAVRPRATSNSARSGTSIAAMASPNEAPKDRNGINGSADSSVPGLAIRTVTTQ